ncbi:MAG: insulinase family protein [Armatimonadetes bacterium]|nr:insulinase family protein [Armatimonadota bacterium]MBX3109230.1 insulinase family protein [Fimbriimonadaceae bacterium]
MIAALIGAALVQTQVKFSVLELPDPQMDHVAIHAYLWRDGAYAKEDAAWRVMAASIGQNSKTYSTSDVEFFGSMAGIRPRVCAAPGFIRVEIVSPPAKWRDSLALAASLIAEPNWRANGWEEKQEMLAKAPADLWRDLVWPPGDFSQKVDGEALANCHARNLDLNGVRVVVSGPVEVGQARDVLAKSAAGWPLPDYRKISRYSEEVKPPDRQATGATSYELTGAPIRVGEKGAAAEFLASVALGIGKGSAVWEQLRERDALAYRVEGFLWPTRQGFVPRLVMIRRAEPNELIHAGTMVNGLKESVKGFALPELARAKVMARQILLRPNAFASVYLDSDSTLFGDRDDDTRWRGLLNGMDLPSVPLARWADALDQVSEEEFRAAAVKMLETAQIHVTRGIPGISD